MLGKVALISVFVGLDGNSWSGEEIDQAHRSLINAGSWIEREAHRWNALVNIAIADTFFLMDDQAEEPVEVDFLPEGDDVGPMEANASAKAFAAASRAAASLGFTDVVGLFREINPRIESDAKVWLFHLRRRGRSHAIPAAEGDISGVGLAICYSRESSFPEPLDGRGRVDPTTVAHELLHLFGATDKYGSSLSSYPTNAVGHRDVMRLSYDALGRMTIDSMTASEIGWRSSSGINPTHQKKPPGPRRSGRFGLT
ncbi:hypothetical protein P12x_001357 [Tundrisphaera lichenicola]|uniref:hypothetical protein n=1 Tax=Tundrisphaera lichenicola TaxID=2029860 RepID=UPI003EBCB285